MITLERLLRSQGFGSRAECRALVVAGRVRIAGAIRGDSNEPLEPEGLRFSVDGVEWEYRQLTYLALNKPVGYECSHRPTHHRSVYSLLPQVLLRRGLQAVGRLDQDTTGLLLLTDDGQFIHRYTSPRRFIPKVYEVATRHPVDDRQLAALLTGVALHDEAKPVAAAVCVRLDERLLRLTVTAGSYHLVKRMVAAAGNRVEGLHRSAIGGFDLPPTLGPGEWIWLETPQLESLARSE